MGHPKAVVDGIGRRAGKVAPSAAEVKRRTGLDQHRCVEVGGAKRVSRCKNSWKPRRRRLAINDSNVAYRITPYVRLISPFTRATVNKTGLGQSGCAARKTI